MLRWRTEETSRKGELDAARLLVGMMTVVAV
jgi:hypothetical protein